MALAARDSKPRPPILVVDDEPDVLVSLRSMFRREFKVHTATRGEEGLAILAQTPISVVLSDQRMPGMSGSEFLAKVRELHPDVIRVMITGYADIESVIAAINRGHVYRYISKPWDPVELEGVIRQSVEQHQLITERKRLMRELEEANRLKTVFITVASHELNTPLTIASGMLELAIAKNRDDAVAGYLQRSLRAARRLGGLLINTFKLLESEDFTRLLEVEPVPLDPLLKEIVADVEPFLKARRQTIAVTVEPADLEIEANREQVRDILENLIGNAIKFSPDERSTRVTIRSVPAANGTVPTMIEIQVIDQGIGIPWEDQPHIFEPFFSTLDTMRHSTGEYGFQKRGAGLGLAIARKFAELHGGSIDFETTPDRGTTFRVRLPIHRRSGSAVMPSTLSGDDSVDLPAAVDLPDHPAAGF
jgi:signal transduction histidine kinase